MIPSAESILEAYEFVRKSRGAPPASQRAVRAALEAARALAREELAEPASLLFAFASYRRAFPGAWSFMAHAIAAQHARSLGYELEAPRAEYDALFSGIMYRTATFEDVRAWVAVRMHPLHQG